MTSELAKMLDGPVAERWGRPDVGWDWGDAPDEVASALWLAHLFQCCKGRIWYVEITPLEDGDVVVDVNQYASNHGLGESPNLLEAIARAMLAVPVEVKP